MDMSSKCTGARVSLVALLLLPLAVDAIVTRHDREEQAFIDLAAKFPATATFRPATKRTGLKGMGTLISPRWVLTAGHVAEILKPGDFADLGGTSYEIEAIILHPDWHGFQRLEDYRTDIALVQLRRAVSDVAPARLYIGSNEAGMTVTFVGRGRYGTGLTGPATYTNDLRAATNRVEKAEGPYLQFRFDAPNDPGVTLLEGISGDGDSGGPAYIELDGETYVIGVSSAQDPRPADRKIGHYGVLEFYPRVSYFADWIQATAHLR
jgi:hypothetical protein